MLDESQPGVLAFHDDIEQDDGDVLLAGEDGLRFSGRVSVQELERVTKDLQALQGKSRRLMHILVVIDDEDPAYVAGNGGQRRIAFVDEGEEFVFVLHLGGRRMRKTAG